MMRDTRERLFDAAEFLSQAGVGRRIVELEHERCFFTQGDLADSVFCLLSGRVKLCFVSELGKQATIAILGPGDFFGEESVAMEAGFRTATAVAINPCSALKIARADMIRALHEEPAVVDRFLSGLVARSRRTQADLVDQLLNTSEKRLARMLLLMAETRKPGEARPLLPPITQEALAEMIGTTRSRVSFFMNRFRSRGLIDYKHRIRVHTSRLKASLVERFEEA
jgi:CRP-like cAMP-binding protein